MTPLFIQSEESMKIVIEAESKEIAEFLSEYARSSHASCRMMEEKIAESILESLIPKKGKKEITTEEVPSGGYFQ